MQKSGRIFIEIEGSYIKGENLRKDRCHAALPAWHLYTSEILVGLSDMYANRVLKVLDYWKKQNFNTTSPIFEKTAEAASPPDKYSERHQLLQRQTRLSEYEIQIVIKQYTNGMNINQLAKKYNCHRTTISQHLKNHGVEIRDLSIPDHLIDKAADLYCSGLSYSKIGKQLGFDGETIRKRIRNRIIKPSS